MALGRAFHTVDADTLKVRFPISVRVRGMTKCGAADDLNNLVLWTCGVAAVKNVGSLVPRWSRACR